MKNIILADDSPTVRKTAEFALSDNNYNFIHAENGAQALEKAKELIANGEELCLCITDINMPEVDGITFIKEFRKFDKFTPILVLTTETENDIIKEGKDSGATGWIIKPFQPQEFREIVQKFIKDI